MTEGDWRRLQITLQALGGSDFSLSATLDDYGSDGTTFASTILDESITLQNAAFAGASTVYAGFHAHPETPSFDEFAFQEAPTAAVPVPAARLLALPLFDLAGLAA